MKIKSSDLKNLYRNSLKASGLLKTLAHPSRLLILCHLVEGEKSAGDLWKRSNLSQSAFSQHLAKLRIEGIVKTRKEAQSIFYSIKSDEAMKILEVMHKIYCG